MTVENGISSSGTGLTILDGVDVMRDLNLFYIRQIGASLRKHVGIQDKLEREIKLRDGASRMLAACTHEDQLLEVAKTLHTSNARMYTYMAELQKLKTAEIMERVLDEEGMQNETKVCPGRIAISDVRIPLMWNDPERYSGGRVKEANRYAVFCLVKVGSEVQDTELVCTDKSTTDVSFRDVLVFDDATHNFKMDIEIYAFPMSDESISAPTPQKLLSRLNRSIGKSEGKRIRDRLRESPAANMKMGPQYEKLGSLTLDLACVEDHIRSHDITDLASPCSASARAKPLLPLYGNLTCRLVAQPRCITDKCVTGFVHCMEMAGGVPSWMYVWCEAKAGSLRYWLNPEDAVGKEPRNAIDLIAHDIRINEIEKSRQKRPNSFQVRDLEERHIFSTNSKEDMNKWIKGLRQHRSDFAAWSNACTRGNRSLPMFIASPSPSKLPSHLLFDSSAKRSLVYEQMSMESPVKSDSEPVEITDMLGRNETPHSVGVAMIEANQSPTPWAGLFSGALNRSITKVTKLRDVQNITRKESPLSKKAARQRTKSCDSILSPGTKSKRSSKKPPLPHPPSQEVLNERRKMHSSAPLSAKAVPRIEGLKSFGTSESCSETGLSDACHSSDDVFFSSDENVLKSPPAATTANLVHPITGKAKATSKGRKKRRAPMPPTVQDGKEVDSELPASHTRMHTRSRSKGSLSSASSLDDILEGQQRTSRKPSRPTGHESYQVPLASPITQRSDVYIQDSDPEGRKSQLSIASNSTQVSNTSSGYKSDSEGISTLPASPANWHKTDATDQDYEILVTEHDVRPHNLGRKGVKVLPTAPLATGKATPRGFYMRSHSWDADAFLSSPTPERSSGRDLEEQPSRSRTGSLPQPSESKSRLVGKPPCLPKPNLKLGSRPQCNKSDKLVMKMLSTKAAGSPIAARAQFSRPTSTPRRSYLTAVESSKVKSPIYETPNTRIQEAAAGEHLTTPTTRGAIPTRGMKTADDTYAQITPKHLRSTNNNNNSKIEEEPVYAQVNKPRKAPRSALAGAEDAPRRVGVDAYTKAHRAIITVSKQRMEEERVNEENARESNEQDVTRERCKEKGRTRELSNERKGRNATVYI